MLSLSNMLTAKSFQEDLRLPFYEKVFIIGHSETQKQNLLILKIPCRL